MFDLCSGIIGCNHHRPAYSEKQRVALGQAWDFGRAREGTLLHRHVKAGRAFV